MKKDQAVEVRDTGPATSGAGGVSISGANTAPISNTVHVYVGDTEASAMGLVEMIEKFSTDTFEIFRSYARYEAFGEPTPYSDPLERKHRVPLDRLVNGIEAELNKLGSYRPELTEGSARIKDYCDRMLVFCPEGYDPEDNMSFYLSYRTPLMTHLDWLREVLASPGGAVPPLPPLSRRRDPEWYSG